MDGEFLQGVGFFTLVFAPLVVYYTICGVITFHTK